MRVILLTTSSDHSEIEGVAVVNEDDAAGLVEAIKAADTLHLFHVRNLVADAGNRLVEYVKSEQEEI